MGKIIFDYLRDQNLSKHTHTNDLSILIGVDRFSFLVSDTQQNVQALKSYHYPQAISPSYTLTNGVNDICRSDALLALPYQSVRIGIQNTHNTLVPDSLYTEGELGIYLRNSIDFPPEDRLQADPISELQLRNIFSVEAALCAVLETYFPKAQLFHHQSAVLKGCAKLAAVQSGHQVFVNVQEKELQVMAFVGRDLLFNNVFPFHSPNDFIYYLLLVYHQFQLKTEVVPLTIAGLLVKDSQIYHLLYRYIRLLNLVQTPDYYRFNSDLQRMDLHFFFDLYSLKLCE